MICLWKIFINVTIEFCVGIFGKIREKSKFYFQKFVGTWNLFDHIMNCTASFCVFQIRAGDVQRPVVANHGPGDQRPPLLPPRTLRGAHAALPCHQCICVMSVDNTISKAECVCARVGLRQYWIGVSTVGLQYLSGLHYPLVV